MDSINPICMASTAITLTKILFFNVSSGLSNVRVGSWMTLEGCFYLLEEAIVNEIPGINQNVINRYGHNKVQRGSGE